MLQWETNNDNITKMKDQLRGQCYNAGSSREGQRKQGTTVPALQSDCPDDSKSCAPNVIEYLSKNEGAKYGMKAGKAVSKGSVDMMKEILKNAKSIALKGTIAFAFVGSFVSAFFPSAGGLPTNPCTFAKEKDWGKCVWEQVQPFVEKFVDAKIDELFSKLWDLTLQGFQVDLWEINRTAYVDSKHFPNGTVSDMPDEVREHMFSDLLHVHKKMGDSAPLFAAGQNLNTTASLYLSMFASMHISVMSSLFGSWEYRTAGTRNAFQIYALCYARRVAERALQARAARLQAVRVEHAFVDQKTCLWIKTPYKCMGERYNYRDDWQGTCDYSARCDQEITCKPPQGGLRGDSCSVSEAQHHFDCHRAYVQEEGDLMWQDWIGAVPDWIEIVKGMQEADVREFKLSELGGNEMRCPF